MFLRAYEKFYKPTLKGISSQFIKRPSTTDDPQTLAIQKGCPSDRWFSRRHHAIDGTCVHIVALVEHETVYVNRKCFHSVYSKTIQRQYTVLDIMSNALKFCYVYCHPVNPKFTIWKYILVIYILVINNNVKFLSFPFIIIIVINITAQTILNLPKYFFFLTEENFG